MDRDIKEVIGALMRALDSKRITPAEVEDLAFEATGELQTVLNQAYVRLLEYAYDCEAGIDAEDQRDQTRTALEQSLAEIVRVAERLAR